MADQTEYVVIVDDAMELCCCKERFKQLTENYKKVIVVGRMDGEGRTPVHCGLGCLKGGVNGDNEG